MKCDEVGKRLLMGTDEAELREHEAACPACAKSRDLVHRLSDEGAVLRTADLSLEKIRETRRRVAHIISEAREQDERPWSMWSLARVATVFASLAILTIFAVVTHVVETDQGRDETEVSRRLHHLQNRVAQYKVQEDPVPSSLERRIGRLKARIRRSSRQVSAELQRAENVRRDI